MTDEDYESAIAQVVRDFHDEFIGNKDRDSEDTMEIAMTYVTFILSRFSKIVEEYESK